MSHELRRYVVAYDVPDDRRRARLARILKGFGDRLQYSVFVVDASEVRRLRMVAKIRAAIEVGEDSVLVCDLGRLESGMERRFETLGRKRPLTDEDSFLL